MQYGRRFTGLVLALGWAMGGGFAHADEMSDTLRELEKEGRSRANNVGVATRYGELAAAAHKSGDISLEAKIARSLRSTLYPRGEERATLLAAVLAELKPDHIGTSVSAHFLA